MDNSVTARLDELALSVAANLWGTVDSWQGADVVIMNQTPAHQTEGFYPEPFFVVTPYVGELSWLFTQLRNIAGELEGYRYWKEEFFGRLATSATRVPSTATIEVLLFATLREAYELLGMIEIGMTMHDWTPVIVHPRVVGEDIETYDFDALKEFFVRRGIGLTQ